MLFRAAFVLFSFKKIKKNMSTECYFGQQNPNSFQIHQFTKSHHNYSNEHNDFKLTFIVRRRQSIRVCSG